MNDLEDFEFELLLKEIRSLKKSFKDFSIGSLQEDKKQKLPEYLTLKEAAELKGITTYENLQKRPWQQPNCGKDYVRVNGHRCFRKKDVLEWLEVTDETLEQYAFLHKADISNHFKNKKNI